MSVCATAHGVILNKMCAIQVLFISSSSSSSSIYGMEGEEETHIGQSYFLFCFCTLLSQWKIGVAFPEESQLQQPCYPTVINY